MIHSIVRWLIVIVAAVLIVKFAIGWLKKQPFDGMARGLSGAFGGLMDTQLLLGLMYFLITGFGGTGFPRFRWEHFITMLIAVVIAHLPTAWKKKADDIRYRNTLFAVIVALLFVAAGIMPLGGWARWWHITGLF